MAQLHAIPRPRSTIAAWGRKRDGQQVVVPTRPVPGGEGLDMLPTHGARHHSRGKLQPPKTAEPAGAIVTLEPDGTLSYLTQDHLAGWNDDASAVEGGQQPYGTHNRTQEADRPRRP